MPMAAMLSTTCVSRRGRGEGAAPASYYLPAWSCRWSHPASRVEEHSRSCSHAEAFGLSTVGVAAMQRRLGCLSWQCCAARATHGGLLCPWTSSTCTPLRANVGRANWSNRHSRAGPGRAGLQNDCMRKLLAASLGAATSWQGNSVPLRLPSTQYNASPRRP